MSKRGYFGVVMYQPKTSHNWGTLLRTANLMGADFIATIGRRYKNQSSDTLKTQLHVPVFHFESFEDFRNHAPAECNIVAVELNDKSRPLKNFVHPERAVYLLGAEDHGLPQAILDKCQHIIQLEGRYSMNVAVAGSIVLYHRVAL